MVFPRRASTSCLATVNTAAFALADMMVCAAASATAAAGVTRGGTSPGLTIVLVSAFFVGFTHPAPVFPPQVFDTSAAALPPRGMTRGRRPPAAVEDAALAGATADLLAAGLVAAGFVAVGLVAAGFVAAGLTALAVRGCTILAARLAAVASDADLVTGLATPAAGFTDRGLPVFITSSRLMESFFSTSRLMGSTDASLAMAKSTTQRHSPASRERRSGLLGFALTPGS
mmetsp:Transcript_35139/g.80448  ORF Transcript_35139/g.80448 Transcript_35139/m.80448 type:complete len:229 (-) Transcript_35139:3-689(-)